jgi:hypothetical protein
MWTMCHTLSKGSCPLYSKGGVFGLLAEDERCTGRTLQGIANTAEICKGLYIATCCMAYTHSMA